MKILSGFACLALAASSAFAAAPAQLPVADHLVFLNELPESAGLMRNAAANGLTITRLDRTSDRVVVTYSYPNGQIATMGYALLSAVGNGDWIAPKPAVVEKRNVTVVSSEPEIIYYEPRYRPRYYYSDPVDNFWLPLTVGVGLGWATSYYGGYYGGYHYHGGGHHGGRHGGGSHGGGGHGGGRGRR